MSPVTRQMDVSNRKLHHVNLRMHQSGQETQTSGHHQIKLSTPKSENNLHRHHSFTTYLKTSVVKPR